MSYRTHNYFQPHSSNTICDITGFKVKSTDVLRRWEGFYVIPEAWNPRQPQDFAPYILKTVTYQNTRFEQANPPDTAVTPPTPI